MNKETAEEIFNLFEEDNYSEAKEKLKISLKEKIDMYLTEKLGLKQDKE